MQTVELAFECFGEQHSGCPLLILHGFFASSRNWRSVAKQLAADRPVYVLDMRNHGDSPHCEQMDYPSMAADLAEFMDCRQMKLAHLMGHSMGGKIVMWFALLHPQRVGKLIVADISPVSYQHNFDRTAAALKELPLAKLNNRKQAEEWLAPAIADQTYRQFLLQNLLLRDGVYSWRINLDYFHRNAHYIVEFPDTTGLAVYQQPVLFLAGEHSAYIQRDAIYALFPLALINEIAGTGHWLHVDAPQVFCRQVAEWLNAAV
jgi:esterase